MKRILPLALAVLLLTVSSASGQVAIRYSPNLRNLRLVEGQENVFTITVINYTPQPIVVLVSDNCDNRRVTVSYPRMIEVPSGSPGGESERQIEVRVRARSAGRFSFEINIDCLAGTPENISGSTVVQSYGVTFAGEVEPARLLASGSVAISYSPNLRNLRLVEGQENVFTITVINYTPQPIVVLVSDNCDNRRVTVSYPRTAEVPAGTPDEGGRCQIEVRVRAKSAGSFSFEINIDCLVGVPENLENVSGAAVVQSYGVTFAGEVKSVGLPAHVVAAIVAAIVLVLLAAALLRMRGVVR